MQKTTKHEIDSLLKKSNEAYLNWKNKNVKVRADFMYAVSESIINNQNELIEIAHEDTKISKENLIQELNLTSELWKNYADALIKGLILDIRIDKDIPYGSSSTTMSTYNVGVGPVAMFGASNWPFLFSTLGTDTASIIAAGCSVMIKPPSSHINTAVKSHDILLSVIKAKSLHEGLIQQVFPASEDSQYLVSHPTIASVGFTGSNKIGRMFFDISSNREHPVPVFSEMGSVNPVFVLSTYFNNNHKDISKQYVTYLVDKTGQYCTNNGIFIIPESDLTKVFLSELKKEIEVVQATEQLNEKISKSYKELLDNILKTKGVHLLGQGIEAREIDSIPTIVYTDSKTFLSNQHLSEEVFGPFGIVVTYKDHQELIELAKFFQCQLTINIFGENEDLKNHTDLINILSEKAGRILYNQFSNGIYPLMSTHHGGTYPSTTDNRFTAFGPYAVKRYFKPLAFQNFTDEYLPDELKSDNPLGLWRIINGEPTKN